MDGAIAAAGCGQPEHEHDTRVCAILQPVGQRHLAGIVPVRGRRGITAETAPCLERWFSTDARSWMNLQDRYELDVAARDKADALRAIRPHEVP